MKIKVWDSNKKVYTKNAKTIDEAFDVVREYLLKTGFDSYYYRQNLLDNKTVEVDYGSHTHFFYMQDQDGEHIFPTEQVFGADEFDYDYDDDGPHSLKELFEEFDMSLKKKAKGTEIEFDVIGVENLTKIIDALTYQQTDLTFNIKISTTKLDPNERVFSLKIMY